MICPTRGPTLSFYTRLRGLDRSLVLHSLCKGKKGRAMFKKTESKTCLKLWEAKRNTGRDSFMETSRAVWSDWDQRRGFMNVCACVCMCVQDTKLVENGAGIHRSWAGTAFLWGVQDNFWINYIKSWPLLSLSYSTQKGALYIDISASHKGLMEADGTSTGIGYFALTLSCWAHWRKALAPTSLPPHLPGQREDSWSSKQHRTHQGGPEPDPWEDQRPQGPQCRVAT